MPLPSGVVRQVVRATHHAPFPRVPGLLARSVTTDPRGLRARYLFDSAAAAEEFSAARDTALGGLASPVTGPVRAVPAAPLTAPVLIVSPPRSGGTALFDALARHPAVWTVGGESEGVIEGVPALHPAACGYASHALDARHAERAGGAVRAGFLADLRNAGGRRLLDGGAQQARPGLTDPAPRLLEKTPENTLRLPFLLRLFPDATVVHLRREPRDTIASIVRAWSHPGFVNIPDLPGWPRRAWHLLLPPGWSRWAGEDLSQIAARQWAAAVEAVLDARPAVPAGHWIEVEYAELCAAPGRTIRRLESALALSADVRNRGERRTGGRDLPLSATTITPPRPGKWRRTPGFDPEALEASDEVAETVRRFAKERIAVPEYTCDSRRPFFACWLDQVVRDPVTANHAGDGDPAVLDPHAVLQAGVTVPLGLVRRTRFRDRFLPGRPILWTDDPGTGALSPYWVRFEDSWALRALSPGQMLPEDFPEGLRAALAAAGALGSAEARAERAARYGASVTSGAEEFARSDACRIGGMVPFAQLTALLDYYERLIASGSWPLGDAQVRGRYGWHNESLCRFFHHQFTDLVGRLAGQPVRPSYAYVSAYRGGAVLNRHVDREQCEYTVSLLLGESGPGIRDGWPLYLDTPRGTLSVVHRPGEAVLFRGTRVPHHRPPLPEGSTHTSLLFHYVPADFRRTLY
ncbi:sulfotransferase family protein [Streptomyces sp. NPDC001118]